MCCMCHLGWYVICYAVCCVANTLKALKKARFCWTVSQWKIVCTEYPSKCPASLQVFLLFAAYNLKITNCYLYYFFVLLQQERKFFILRQGHKAKEFFKTIVVFRFKFNCFKGKELLWCPGGRAYSGYSGSFTWF